MPRIAEVDAYIAKAAPFAQPILRHLRERVHAGCPQAVETIKWGMPSFTHHGILCGMAAFKQHCAFGFWKHARLFEAGSTPDEAMGQYGRLTSVDQLPDDATLEALVRKAAALNERGDAGMPKKARSPRPPAKVPADLAAALAKNEVAQGHFERFSPSAKREYIEWLEEARTDATRDKRRLQALEWIAEGKPRNWKYMKK